jgi:hypothetical protein
MYTKYPATVIPDRNRRPKVTLSRRVTYTEPSEKRPRSLTGMPVTFRSEGGVTTKGVDDGDWLGIEEGYTCSPLG